MANRTGKTACGQVYDNQNCIYSIEIVEMLLSYDRTLIGRCYRSAIIAARLGKFHRTNQTFHYITSFQVMINVWKSYSNMEWIQT